jgi:hypothetical protein
MVVAMMVALVVAGKRGRVGPTSIYEYSVKGLFGRAPLQQI